ncbi:MAG: hypothetical protein RBT71_07705 [Flavobacteriales bacterium]|jgi:hypothetical protein|nr:hypothetical protein [Flavobacteriales bacterium]
MRYLSERVSVDRGEERTSVVIGARLPKWREAMLVTWALAWTACGIYVVYARSGLPPGDPLRQYLLIFLAFWAYFLLRAVKAVLWRLKGFELWRIKEGQVTIKDSILGFGTARTYFVENIQRLGLLRIDPTSWKWQLNNSDWVIGGERLGFDHLGRKVVFGKGLTDEEAAALLKLLQQELRRERKAVAG